MSDLFQPGDRVAYHPTPDRTEYGTVKRFNNKYVFVSFDRPDGDWGQPALDAVAVDPNKLQAVFREDSVEQVTVENDRFSRWFKVAEILGGDRATIAFSYVSIAMAEQGHVTLEQFEEAAGLFRTDGEVRG